MEVVTTAGVPIFEPKGVDRERHQGKNDKKTSGNEDFVFVQGV